MEEISLQLVVKGVARADVLLTPERVYYRMATVDTLDEGDVPGPRDEFNQLVSRIVKALKLGTSETICSDPTFSFAIKIGDNYHRTASEVSEKGVRRLVSEVVKLDSALEFLQGFV